MRCKRKVFNGIKYSEGKKIAPCMRHIILFKKLFKKEEVS